jgi:uncharacterized protein YjiK
MSVGGVKTHPSFEPFKSDRGDKSPAKFKMVGSSKVDIKEASDIVSVPGGGFLVVGDITDQAEYFSPTGQSIRFKLEGVKNGFSGLEAIAFDPASRTLFVASEEKQKLYRYSLSFGADGEKPRVRLDREWHYELDGRANKGVEGLAFLPGEHSPTGRPHLVMAKEGDPKQLLLLDQNGEGRPVEIDLDNSIKDAAKDFSALTVDPLTGHLFITSDESSLLAEVKLTRKAGKIKATLVQALPLRDGNGEPLTRVEGCTFDERGNLFILQENSRKLVELKRK